MKKIKAAAIVFLLLAGAATLPLLSQQDHGLLLEGDRTYAPPFEKGELMRFEISWKPVFFFPAFKAGTLTLDIRESTFRGKPTYLITAVAESGGTLARVAGFDVRDEFESEIDRKNFRSYRMVQRTRQGDKKKNLELIFDYQRDKTRVREVDLSTDPPKETRNEEVDGISGPAIDMLSVFYVVRLPSLEPGDRFLINLADKGKFQKVAVRAEKYDEVDTPLGEFDTIKLSTQGGIFSNGGDFHIWYDQDDVRAPVKFETDVKFGKVYGSISKLQSGSKVRGLIKSSPAD